MVKDSITFGLKCDHNRTCCLRSDKNVLNFVHNFLARKSEEVRRDIAFDSLVPCKYTSDKDRQKLSLTPPRSKTTSPRAVHYRKHYCRKHYYCKQID